MLGHLDCRRTSLAMQGQTKYRPIAPKPTLHMDSNLCKSTASDSHSVPDFSSTLNTTHKGNNTVKGGHSRNGNRRRRASDCPSSRVLKRARFPTVGASVKVNRCHFQGSKKPAFEKPELEVWERETANAFKGRSLVDKKHEELEMMNANGEVGVENPATNMEAVPVPQMGETQFVCGSANYFVFPIVSDVAEKEEKNLVTLPLLPQTPVSRASNSASPDASCKILLRLFGRDFSHVEVGDGACQVSSNESPKPRNFVPIAGLSFL